MSQTGRKRTAILISGRGSNMSALLQAAMEPSYPASISLVISNKADAKGLENAAAAGIETRVIPFRDHGHREAHDAAIDTALREENIQIVALAGYMRILTPEFVKRWTGKLINIHPSLLPLFKGLDTHQRALDAGVRVHGCSVHFVTAQMDQGPIIAQACVPVLTGDSEESLATRVLEAEHRIYPEALAMLARGDVRMSANGKAVFRK